MTLSRSIRWGVLVCVVLVVGAACGSDGADDTSSDPKAAGDASLTGTPWRLSDATSLGVPLSGVAVTAEFDDGQMIGSSGCNTYRASFETDLEALTIGPDIAGTRKACEPAPTAVEQAYLARLPQVSIYEIVENTLTLRSMSGQALLVYEVSEGATEIIGQWTATSYYTGDAIEGVVTGSELTADFDGTEISGNGGCNGFSGPYAVSGQTIEIGPLASTTRACTDDTLNTQEQHYLAALPLATSYRITGNRLDLLRDGGTIAATFDRTPTAG
jgi:heat shock protein HslJ